MSQGNQESGRIGWLCVTGSLTARMAGENIPSASESSVIGQPVRSWKNNRPYSGWVVAVDEVAGLLTVRGDVERGGDVGQMQSQT